MPWGLCWVGSCGVLGWWAPWAGMGQQRMARGTGSGNSAAQAQLWHWREGFGPAAELGMGLGRRIQPRELFLDAGKSNKATPCPIPAWRPLTHTVLRFPVPELLPPSGSLRPAAWRCSGGAFRGGRFILPRGNRIIDLPSSPRGNPVSFPCSGGEEVSGLVLTVPGGQWIPREGNPPSSPGGSPFPKSFPQGPLIPEGAMGPQFQSPFWVGVLVLAGEGLAAPACGWCRSKTSLIQH